MEENVKSRANPQILPTAMTKDRKSTCKSWPLNREVFMR